MRVISSDGRLQHGRAPAAALIDELWAFDTAREEQTYTALSSALHKRDDAYVLAISTAGYDKHTLLGRIYEAALGWPQVTTTKNGCLTIAKDTENGQLLWWYGAPESADVEDDKIWKAVNPASWIQMRDLRRQLHALLSSRQRTQAHPRRRPDLRRPHRSDRRRPRRTGLEGAQAQKRPPHRRRVIERAKGIMMSRHEIDERRAFELLRSQSQRSGRKVCDVAEAVIESHLLLVPHERSL